jgi:hypothetical protein
MSKAKRNSVVDHPSHYNASPSGIEAIDVLEWMTSFNIATAMKYLWRAGHKDPNPRDDIEKCIWYCKRELERLEKEQRK